MATRIKTLNKTHLTNGAHAEFHESVKVALIKGMITLGIKEMLTPYETEIRLELTLINRQHGSIYTNNIIEADHVRDNAIGTLLRVIDAFATLPDADLSETARDLKILVKPYRGINSHEMMKQTAETEGLTRVLNEVENMAMLKKIGLDVHLYRITQANDAFKDLVAERDKELADRQPVADTETRLQRRKVDAMYTDITERVYALALIGTAEQIPVAEQAIADINERVDHYRHVLASEHRTPATPPAEPDPLDDETFCEDDFADMPFGHLPFGLTDEE